MPGPKGKVHQQLTRYASPGNICKHIDDCLQRTSPQGTKVIATYVSPNGAMLLNTYVPQRVRRPSTTYWTASAARMTPSSRENTRYSQVLIWHSNDHAAGGA